MTDSLLQVKDLYVDLYSPEGIVHAVSGVNLNIEKGEMAGLVGESGCGKSVTARSILRILPRNIVEYGQKSQILFDGKNILTMNGHEMKSIRGKGISMIFQDPMSSLNPVMKVSSQIIECVYLHRSITKKSAAWELADAMLSKVGFVDPGRVLGSYPHELSGGMCQRVVIAMALCSNPLLLIADESTTALDVTVQMEILELILALSKDYHMSVLLITHDFGVVAKLCDKVNVMYAGQIIEKGDVFSIFEKPLHPYTEGLIASLIDIAQPVKSYRGIPGSVPNLMSPPSGCRFQPRCLRFKEACKKETPPEVDMGQGRVVRCWLYS